MTVNPVRNSKVLLHFMTETHILQQSSFDLQIPD